MTTGERRTSAVASGERPSNALTLLDSDGPGLGLARGARGPVWLTPPLRFPTLLPRTSARSGGGACRSPSSRSLSVLALVAIFAVWANRQLLDTENWTETSSELLADEAILGEIAVFLVDQLYANVDVQGQLEEALPTRAQPLAGPAAGGLKDLAVDAAEGLLARPHPQARWTRRPRSAEIIPSGR